jgi:diaminopimelate decarboxylase
VSTPDVSATGTPQVPAPLEQHVWPTSADLTPTGELVLAGHAATDLARDFGTPAFVMDEKHFRDRARLFRDSFTEAFAAVGAEVDVYYAGKSFLSVAVARWAREEGLRVDTCTGGELAVALRAGVPGAEIGLHGNNKSDAEISRAIEAGVGRVVVDSFAEIDRVAELARDAGRDSSTRVPVMVRVTTGIHAGGHEFISTAHEDQKFGVSLTGGQALAALRAVLDHPELELLGAHTHIGSQIQDAAAFEANARKMLALRADLETETGYLLPETSAVATASPTSPPRRRSTSRPSPATSPVRWAPCAPSSARRSRASRSSPVARSSDRPRSRSTRSVWSSRSPSTTAACAPTCRSTAG